jgi:hypothetical protein
VPNRSRTPVAPVAAGAVVGLVLTGCAGEGAPSSTPAPTVTETVTATATVTASPSGPPSVETCGQVAFEENTDAGAFDIRATGVRCEVARRVASVAEGQRGKAYDAPRGFSCVPRGTVGQLPSVAYECTGPADQRVRFEAS